MKVAIMGAGMSGLSCAITLEQQGVEPEIFERRSRVGDRFINAEATLSVLNRPINNGIEYLAKEYNINLKPLSEINKLVIHSKNELGCIEGRLGYINLRGRHGDSYESQLGRAVKTKINFNSKMEYPELCKNFDYVVLAPGDGGYAANLGNYRSDLTCTLKGATVEGEFEPNMPHVWINNEILPKGYAWVLPFNNKEANIVIAYPDYPNNIKLDINNMWNNVYNLISKKLDQSFRITDSFEVTRYMVGICNKPKIDNTYYVGNCFGSISPWLGFGQFISILTGVYAAYDICGLGKYEELTKPLFENYNHSLVFKRYMEDLTDDIIDFQVKNLDNVLISKLIDKMASNDSDVQIVKGLTPLMRLWNEYNKMKNKNKD